MKTLCNLRRFLIFFIVEKDENTMLCSKVFDFWKLSKQMTKKRKTFEDYIVFFFENKHDRHATTKNFNSWCHFGVILVSFWCHFRAHAHSLQKYWLQLENPPLASLAGREKQNMVQHIVWYFMRRQAVGLSRVKTCKRQ